MEDLPKCPVANCDQTARMFVKKLKLYNCYKHFDLTYNDNEGERLVSPKIVAKKVGIIEQMLRLFTCFTQKECNNKPDEITLKFQQEFTLQVQKLRDDIIHAYEQESYPEFRDLIEKARNIQAGMDDNETFSRFARNIMWKIMREKIDQDSETPAWFSGLVPKKQNTFQEELKQNKLAIEAQDQKNKKLQQQNEELKRILKLRSQESTSEQSSSTVSTKNAHGRQSKPNEFNEESTMRLELTNPKHMDFLIILNRRMPILNRLDLNGVPANNPKINTFLKYCFPVELKFFNFNCSSPLSSDLDFYVDALAGASAWVREVYSIYNFEVCEPQLKTLVCASKHMLRLGFQYCKFYLPTVPDFGGKLKGSVLKVLDLSSCGRKDYSNWVKNQVYFENLIEGLSKEEDFRASLQKIWLNQCGMQLKIVKRIMSKHGFAHVEICGHTK
ncbi:unnamed protein product [Moneuplotes crassus]|uniref:Uncharacterized protein n=1 Tax=Euplotes crassus TaxID=5936 RepID=A0AAD1Y2F3_EUPCR|nr:unnamed protein product [Moneuplotes crassus]